MRWGKFQQFLLLLGDVSLLYLSLFITLIARYGAEKLAEQWQLHILPFSIIYAIWILVFYTAKLYEGINIQGIIGTFVQLVKTLTVSGLIAIALFYLIPLFIITPRINLFITLSISLLLLTVWRWVFYQSIRSAVKLNVLMLGNSQEIAELVSFTQKHPLLGYKIIAQEKLAFDHSLLSAIQYNNISIIVASKSHQSDREFVNMLYETLPLGVTFMDFSSFYEKITGKIPISLISKLWFLENLAETEKKLFEIGKRAFDVVASLVLGFITIALFFPIALLIKIESRGAIFYKHKRIGKNKKEFELIKFRTMYRDSEKNGPQWARHNDPRVTYAGRLLRKTRIDELPQTWNVIRGDLSFIGPRPERPEFVNDLRKKIPFYDMRLLVRPGLSGWAQINPPYYYGSEEEAYLKLQYDLFYIKNRGLGLDLSIMLKTLSVLFSRLGR